MRVGADMVNGHGMCHGGFLFTLADSAFACACNSPGPVTVAAGADVVFVSSGLMTMRALQAAEDLGEHGVDVAVVHSPTIKPFDSETVLGELAGDRLAVTLENHTVVGGLFETLAAELVRAGRGTRVVPIGLPDEFLAAGALPTLHERYGLARGTIVDRVLAELG